jgi:hypothetical protein
MCGILRTTGTRASDRIADADYSGRRRDMRNAERLSVRITELRAMLAAYRHMTVEEVEDSGWGDLEIEIEGELWRLEQELHDLRDRRFWAA